MTDVPISVCSPMAVTVTASLPWRPSTETSAQVRGSPSQAFEPDPVVIVRTAGSMMRVVPVKEDTSALISAEEEDTEADRV